MYNNNTIEKPADNHGIERVLERVRRADYVCPKNNMRFQHDRNADGRSLGYSVSLNKDGAVAERFNTNQHFRKQLASKLGGGLTEYSRHLHDTGQRELLAHNFNKQLERQEGKALIRTIGEDRTARAFLSTKYKVVDDVAVFGPIVENIQKRQDDYRTLGGQRTDTRTFLKFISKEPVAQIGKRTMFAGFQAGNSEVGQGSASIKSFLFDSFCENGLVFGSMEMFSAKFRHVGSEISTDFGEVFNELQMAQSEEIINKLQLSVAKALDPSTHTKIAEIVERGHDRKITGDMGAVLKEVGGRYKLTKQEQQDVLLKADESEAHSYGVQAAITALAQDAKSYDRRAELEEIGGKVLEMSDSQWDNVASAVA